MLAARGLHCVRGRRTLFEALSFSLAAGELLRIAGANGSGKTSLLRILCGLLAPASGEVLWQGEPVGALREEYSRHLVYIGHAPGLKEELTAAENLRFGASISGFSVPGRAIADALAGLGVPDAAIPVKTLSQGQRRRAALARLALSQAVPLWLLDEPFAALDQAATQCVEDLVAQHVAAGGAVVYTTHQPSRIGGRVIDLDA